MRKAKLLNEHAKLGARQRDVLYKITESRAQCYQRGCGWQYESHSETRGICETLVNRGWLRKGQTPGGLDTYRPTAKALEHATWVKRLREEQERMDAEQAISDECEEVAGEPMVPETNLQEAREAAAKYRSLFEEAGNTITEERERRAIAEQELRNLQNAAQVAVNAITLIKSGAIPPEAFEHVTAGDNLIDAIARSKREG
jgi:hypothetical protein